jgi:hypothetical protein
LASSKGKGAKEIVEELGCSGVRNTINAFNKEGIKCLRKKSCRPNKLQRIFDIEKCEKLREILHETPRKYGKETSLWTLELAAIVLYEKGLTPSKYRNNPFSIKKAKCKLGKSKKLDKFTRPKI